MVTAILGRKLGMTQIYEPNGTAIPVTAIESGPCPVVQVKTVETDGYNALKIGFGAKRRTPTRKPQAGEFKKAGISPVRVLREIRTEKAPEQKPGDNVTVDIFKDVKRVHVTGVGKGKGFQGTVKRHHFTISPRSHGYMVVRTPGSMGQSSCPSRVHKGKRLPGRMGGETVTVKNLEVVRVDPDRNLLLVRGSVPGIPGTILYIRKGA